jgi:hypothetical protein
MYMENWPDLLVFQDKHRKNWVLQRCKETDTCIDKVGILEEAPRKLHRPLLEDKRDSPKVNYVRLWSPGREQTCIGDIQEPAQKMT